MAQAYGDLSNAIKMAHTTFFVGIHHTLTKEDVIEVANIINETFA